MKKHNLRLVSLSCHLTDEKDADEVFLVFNKNQVWPINKKFFSLKNGKIPVNIDLSEIEDDGFLTLELWDYDRFSQNDNIGTFTMKIDNSGGPYYTDLVKTSTRSKAKYTLEWEVV